MLFFYRAFTGLLISKKTMGILLTFYFNIAKTKPSLLPVLLRAGSIKRARISRPPHSEALGLGELLWC